MKKFQRTIEDFACRHCGFKVKGSGYTNHCPRCLYSKHVDVNPGDRLNSCGGLMKPVGAEVKRGGYILIHQCEKCSVVKRNKTSPRDNFEEILKLGSQAP